MTKKTETESLSVKQDGKGKIYSHIRKMWLHETPEERVRQDYLVVLVNEYGFSLDQIGEEVSVVERGAAQARADFLVWRTPQDKSDGKKPIIVVECKADTRCSLPDFLLSWAWFMFNAARRSGARTW